MRGSMPKLSAARLDQSRTKKYRDLNIQVVILSYKRRLLVCRPGLVWRYLKSIRDSDALDLSPSSRRAAILRFSLSPRVLLELLPLQRHSKQQARTGKTQKGFFSNHFSLLKTTLPEVPHYILVYLSMARKPSHDSTLLKGRLKNITELTGILLRCYWRRINELIFDITVPRVSALYQLMSWE